MKPNDFFYQHPVFTSQEYAAFVKHKGHGGIRSQEALLAYHIKVGNLIRIKRGLFAVVPQGSTSESFVVDPYLIASKLVDDAVIAYHSALAFLGKTYSVTNQFCILTNKRPMNFFFRGNHFRLVSFPKSLREKNKELLGTKTVLHRGCQLSITDFERTLVDMLDRPELSGGWEEVWRSLESVEYFDIEKIVKYALLLGKSKAIALVGFYLSQHQEELSVKDLQLKQLEKRRPKQPLYIDRRQKVPGKFNARWNIILPQEINEQWWNE